MLVLRSRLSSSAASGREVAGALSVEPAAALLPEDFRPDRQNENELRGISKELERMTRELPERPEAYYFLLLSHILLGQSEEAKALLAELHRPVRRFVPLRLLKKEQSLESDVGPDGLTERAATGILADPDELSSWERAWLRAQKELHAGNWSVAALAYNELLGAAEEPFVGASLQARIERGIARLELEDYRGAIDDFYRAWGRWPELQEPALLLGKAYYLSGDPEGAEYVFNELHDGMPEPERKRAARWIAAVYHQLGDRVKELEWAAHVDGSLRSRLQCWPLLWDGRCEEAADCFREALRRYRDDLNLLSGLGYSLAFLTEGRRGAQRDKQVAELLGIAEKRANLLFSRPEKERDKLLEAGACYILTVALRRQEDYEGALAAVNRFRQDGEYHQLVDIAYAGVRTYASQFDEDCSTQTLDMHLEVFTFSADPIDPVWPPQGAPVYQSDSQHTAQNIRW
ncbi:MAG: hypothetical protein JXA90_14050 [Planctomycetes bacterium]|nr:hypothetical protein [Planctomycetota bacterium]